jgi:membrane protein required for colicin V production
MITKTLKLVALGMINRIFGGIFGLLKWATLLSSFVLVTQEINEIITFIPQERVEGSISYSLLYELGDFFFNWLSNSQIIQEKQIVYQIIY